MRGFGTNKVLGLAIGERGVTACELTRAGGAGGAARANCAEFVYPPGVSPDDPAALGKALREFLNSRRLSARRAVVGLPLKWAVVKQKEVPPSSPAALAGMLRLQAERDFAMEPQDLVLEYAGEPSPTAPGTVLLVAVPRKRLEAVTAMAEAAGLSVQAVTLSSIALAEATARLTNGEGAVLHVTAGTAELAVQHRGHPRVLRHLRAPLGAAVVVGESGIPGPGVSTPGAEGEAGAGAAPPSAPTGPPAQGASREPTAALTLELRQVLSLMPQNGTAGSGELALWDGLGLGDAPRVWADTIGVSVREPSLDSLGVTAAATNGTAAATPAADGGRFAPAVALGLLGLGAGPVSPDLLHSRLVERKKSRVAKPLVWGVVVGCVVIFGIVAAVVDLSRQRREVEEFKTRLDEMKPKLKTAEATIARDAFAQRWLRQDPRFLTCLRDLTAVFPDDAQIWATRVNLLDDGRGTLEGQATNGDVVKAGLRRLQESKHFTEVKVLTIGEAGRNSREVNFTVTFRFTSPPPPAPGGAAPATRGVGATPAPAPPPAPTTTTTTNPVNTGAAPALNRSAAPATAPGTRPAAATTTPPTTTAPPPNVERRN